MSPCGSKQMTEEEKLFLTAESQLMKVEKVLDLEEHHLATITIITNSGKNYQWGVKTST